MNILFDYVLLVVVRIYGYFLIVDRLIRIMILVPYVFLTTACV